MDSHHSLHRRPPCGFDMAFAILVFAAKPPAASPIRMNLNGITATATADPVPGTIHPTPINQKHWKAWKLEFLPSQANPVSAQKAAERLRYKPDVALNVNLNIASPAFTLTMDNTTAAHAQGTLPEDVVGDGGEVLPPAARLPPRAGSGRRRRPSSSLSTPMSCGGGGGGTGCVCAELRGPSGSVRAPIRLSLLATSPPSSAARVASSRRPRPPFLPRLHHHTLDFLHLIGADLERQPLIGPAQHKSSYGPYVGLIDLGLHGAPPSPSLLPNNHRRVRRAPPIRVSSIRRSMAAAHPEKPGADSRATGSELPAYIVLDDEAYMEDLENATTAVGKTRSGHRRVKVSFFAADPPRLSHFCVHCPRMTTKFDFRGRPRVLHAEDNLALISIGFACGPTTEYIFYRAAGRGRRPSIEPLPKIVGKYLGEQSFVASVGFRPCGGDGGGYVVAALALTLVAEESELHVFRSERGTWTKTVLAHGRHLLCMVEKVIAMGAGELGFVSLLKGIIVCDVLSDNPTGRFVPLPKLLPANKDHSELCSARPFRDVAGYADGLIKCVEVEPLSRITIHKVPQEVDMVEEETYEYLGWRVIVWSRMPSSTSWRKECLIHVDDIIANTTPTRAALLGELGGSRAPSLSTLKELHVTSCPYFGNGLKYQLQPLMPPTAHPHPPPLPPPPQSVPPQYIRRRTRTAGSCSLSSTQLARRMAIPPMATATARKYVEFAPPHSLQEEPGVLALRVDLTGQGKPTRTLCISMSIHAGFKKEQIRVQIDSFGRLRIRGERPVDAEGRQWKRFGKEFEVPDTCDAAGIRARFDKDDGVLLITMPKLSAAAAEEPKAPGANTGVAAGGPGYEPARRTGASPAGAAAAEAGEEKGKEEDARTAAMDRTGQQDEPHPTGSDDENDAAASAARRPAAYGFGKDRRRILLAIFAVMLALVAAGLFARYRLTMDPSAETASSGNHAVKPPRRILLLLGRRHELLPPSRAQPPGRDTAATMKKKRVLLNITAAVGIHSNRTSAKSLTRNSVPRPPQLSTVFVHTSDLNLAADDPPEIVRSEDDLLLLRVNVGKLRASLSPDDCDYFIYHAHPTHPSLELLRRPHPFFHNSYVGLLPRSGGHYTLAALVRTGERNLYKLHMSTIVSAPEQLFPVEIPSKCYRILYHHTTTVIPIGGERGTMGFVDLWRGILLCDVLDPNPTLRCMPLPLPLQKMGSNHGLGEELGYPGHSRGISFIRDKGCLSFVHNEVTGNRLPGYDAETGTIAFHVDDWTLTTWSNKEMSGSLDDWKEGVTVQASTISIDHGPVVSQALEKSGLLCKPHNSEEAAAARQQGLQNLMTFQPTPCAKGEDVAARHGTGTARHYAARHYVVPVPSRAVAALARHYERWSLPSRADGHDGPPCLSRPATVAPPCRSVVPWTARRCRGQLAATYRILALMLGKRGRWREGTLREGGNGGLQGGREGETGSTTSPWTEGTMEVGRKDSELFLKKHQEESEVAVGVWGGSEGGDDLRPRHYLDHASCRHWHYRVSCPT
ncbi:hypothetical protein HU200_023902 [Digitaria exilis]|uniref:SHSP domain-containing protein n=1 Tax=Digitaria exilis TaxID=1010633 RepID=A0A835C3Z0_9POAL|nr:hypothetical protein HU200_023902 [Digitaria exilis]